MSTETFEVTVTQARWEADGVVSLSLRGHAPLPAWTAGAHVDLVLPSGAVRQYSLCGEPSDPEYRIAVLREPDGRGGSAEIHDTALVGRRLGLRGPRNRFVLEPAAAYEFVAGGIGVTPLLAMVRRAVADRIPWRLHHGGRRPDTLAFTGELHRLAERSGGEVVLRTDDVHGPLPLAEIVAGAPAGAAVYACGPSGMLAALEEVAPRVRPDVPVRLERFVADPAAARPPAGAVPGPDGAAAGAGGFEVELARTGETVAVPPGGCRR